MCASAKCNNNNFTAATSATTATSPMSEPSASAPMASKTRPRSPRRQKTPKKSSHFILAIVIFTSTLLATITPTTEAIPVVPLNDNFKSNEPSTYGCPAPELCIERCKTMNSRGYCGEYPRRSCFCTL
ncbi:hypothetical protein BGW39_000709 [Mortierella sp. 14UC]|nr:hypothetical protein BGW39_000709 [Mortierella sp. 14UC]